MSPRAFFIALIKVNPEAVSKNQNIKHQVIPNQQKMGKNFLKIPWVQILFEPNFHNMPTRLHYLVKYLLANEIFGELIYTYKMIQPGIFSRFSQPVYFSRL